MNKKELGQAAVVIGLAMVALLVIVGLAVDGGNLLMSRRAAQNAADAAALAGTRELAAVILDCGSGTAAEDAAVFNAMNEFAAQNGLDADGEDQIAAWYVDKDLVRLGEVGAGDIPNGATGVEVSLSTVQRTFFIHLLGPEETTAPATATAMTGPIVRFSGGVLPVATPLDVVQALGPDEDFYVMETNNQHNGGMFCVDEDGVTCIGDPASHNAHRGWLNLNYIYNTEYLAQSSPFYRTFEQNVPNRGCGSDPDTSADDGLKGWAGDGCPYPFPIFAGGVGAIDGDFIHGDPGARQVSLDTIYDVYAGEIAYIPVFDYVYMSDYMDEYFDQPEGIGWPRAGGGGHAFLYHIVGFTAVEVGNENGHVHYLHGSFQEASIGQGVIQPGSGIGGACQASLLTHAVVLWR